MSHQCVQAEEEKWFFFFREIASLMWCLCMQAEVKWWFWETVSLMRCDVSVCKQESRHDGFERQRHSCVVTSVRAGRRGKGEDWATPGHPGSHLVTLLESKQVSNESLNWKWFLQCRYCDLWSCYAAGWIVTNNSGNQAGRVETSFMLRGMAALLLGHSDTTFFSFLFFT